MLCKVNLARVCGTGVHLARDELSMHPTTPIIMGHETVGEIMYLPDCIKTDVAGTPVKVGDRIMWSHLFCGTCYSCKVLHEPCLCERSRGYGFSNAYELRGGYAEYEVVLAARTLSGFPTTSPPGGRRRLRAGRTVVNAFDKLYAARRHPSGRQRCCDGLGPVGLYAIVMAAQSAPPRSHRRGHQRKPS
jgi:D-arabinose 1-dehydrogenase-like Zn-dependent alcohol dehydrogenase